MLDIAAALDGPFRPWFSGPSWDSWRAVLRAAYGLPMTSDERAFFRTVADRDPPRERVREWWNVIGRGGGKDSTVSAVATHSGATFDPAGLLRPGERALVACIACDRDQAKIVKRYIQSYFEEIPPLAAMVARTTDDGLELTNQVDISVMTGSFRSIRGRPILTAILDECAYYRDETSTTPDLELYRALLPGMRLPQSMMIGISSPYRKAGLLYDRWRKHYGEDSDDVLVVQAPSHVMNPTLDTRDRDRQMVEDPSAARAEWYAEFRDDLVSFIDPAVVDRAVVSGRTELPPMPGISYTAGVDPSGGSSDSMTLAIAHSEGERGILDLVREWRPPFSPEQVVREIAEVCRRYNVKTVIGDRYGGEWPRERCRVHGLEYQLASMTRSDLYLTLLPALNTPGRIELLDERRLISQLCGLERRATRSGKDSVAEPRGSNDDIINSAAISLVGAALAPKSSAENWIEYYRRLNEAAGVNTSMFGYDVTPETEKTHRVRVPEGVSTIYLIDGTSKLVPADRIVEVSKEDAIALGQRGWERPD